MARRSTSGGVPPARSSIIALKQQGFTEAQIGRAVGRNSSLISQISRGKKPGANLAPALAELSRGGTPKEPARRTNKAGGVAKTRAQTSHTTDNSIRGGASFEDRLERLARAGVNIHVRTTWRNANLDYKSGRRSSSPGATHDLSSVIDKPDGTKSTVFFGSDYGSNLAGNTQGVPARKVLADFRKFKKKHSTLKGRALLEAYATARANGRITMSGRNGGVYKQTADGFIDLYVIPIHENSFKGGRK